MHKTFKDKPMRRGSEDAQKSSEKECAKEWSKEETMWQGRMPNQSLKGWRSVQKARNALPMDVRIKGRACFDFGLE